MKHLTLPLGAIALALAAPGFAQNIEAIAPAAAGHAPAAMPRAAQRADLPPIDAVTAGILDTPGVNVANAQIAAARAQALALGISPYEPTVTASYLRRSVDREKTYNEFDVTVARPFRLPGKAALDRRSGQLGMEVAAARLEDALHQAALSLSGLWHDWLLAAALHRSDLQTASIYEAALKAVTRRMQLRDASQLEVDQAGAATALAQAQVTSSRMAMERARATIEVTFPRIPMPPEAPELTNPELPPEPLEQLQALVVERSDEIRAASLEADRLASLYRRARADRIGDPSIGLRAFSERDGAERGLGIVGSIPLGRSYRRASADVAAAQASAAARELIQVRRSVGTIAQTDLIEARTRLAGWEANVRAATSAAEAARRTLRGHALGGIDLTDLLYAQRTANEARRAEITARAEALRALFRLRIDSHTVWAETHGD